MKKYLFLIILMGIVVTLQGCGKTYKTQINFDNFTCEIKATTTFQEVTDKEKEAISKNLSIEQAYTSQEQSGFIDSIIINKDLNTNTITLEKIGEITVQKSAKRLQGFKADNAKMIEIECGDESIPAYKQSFVFDSITPKEQIYSTQIFFIYNDYLYSISTATEDKDNDDEIASSLKKITCKTK